MSINAGAAATLLTNGQNQALAAASRMTHHSLLQRVRPMTDLEASRAAQDFESMFVAQMLEPMFGDSVGEELFGDKDTQDVYKTLLMDEYGKLIARAGGIGIASTVKKELLSLQEVQS